MRGSRLVYWAFSELHGLALVINHGLQRLGFLPWYGCLPRFVRAMIIFHFTAILWVFFRSPDISTVVLILGGLATPAGHVLDFLDDNAFTLTMLGLFFATHLLDDHRRVFYGVRRWGRPLSLALMVVAWLVAITISTGSSGKFIYFDF